MSGPGDQSNLEGSARRRTAVELVLRQALAGAPWRQSSADIMRKHGITEDEIEYEMGRYQRGEVSPPPCEKDDATLAKERAALMVDIVQEVRPGSRKQAVAEFRQRMFQAQPTEKVATVSPQVEVKPSIWHKFFGWVHKRKKD